MDASLIVRMQEIEAKNNWLEKMYAAVFDSAFIKISAAYTALTAEIIITILLLWSLMFSVLFYEIE